MDLGLNNLKMLICQKSKQTNKQTNKQVTLLISFSIFPSSLSLSLFPFNYFPSSYHPPFLTMTFYPSVSYLVLSPPSLSLSLSLSLWFRIFLPQNFIFSNAFFLLSSSNISPLAIEHILRSVVCLFVSFSLMIPMNWSWYFSLLKWLMLSSTCKNSDSHVICCVYKFTCIPTYM